jgi:hypothetical protein
MSRFIWISSMLCLLARRRVVSDPLEAVPRAVRVVFSLARSRVLGFCTRVVLDWWLINYPCVKRQVVCRALVVEVGCRGS